MPLLRPHVLPLFAALALASSVAVAAPDCTPQASIDVATIQPQIVLLDEIHGNVEMPAFTEGLVCSLLRSGRSVILAIERDGNEQDGLNRYLDSDGGEAARDQLLQASSWRQRCQDGRTSAAMLTLIESMRRLRQAGQRVGILAFDLSMGLKVPMTDDEKARLGPADNVLVSRIYDRSMADTLLFNAILYRRYTIVALTGHAYTDKGYAGDPDFMPMGALVSAQAPTFIIGFETARPGTSWRAGGKGCKAIEIEAGPQFHRTSRIDAVVPLDTLTASRPAFEPAAR